MLSLPDAWVWDSWYLDDGQYMHAFYLKASRALLDPDRRHHRASIGHAISRDLINWSERADALVAADSPAFDDLATWTGSVVRGPDGGFHLFYTGISREFGDVVQRIGHAVSADLITWTRIDAPPITADARWYETYSVTAHEPWRDPWVFYDDAAGAWRMLITASTAEPSAGTRGCVGTAVSDDLITWSVQPPLTEPSGLHQFEVPQTIVVDGHAVLVWCMRDVDLGPTAARPSDRPAITGTWTAPAASLSGPFQLARAEPIDVEGTYAGRVVLDRAGSPQLLAFRDRLPDGGFGGSLIDPVPLRLTSRGTLQPVT